MSIRQQFDCILISFFHIPQSALHPLSTMSDENQEESPKYHPSPKYDDDIEIVEGDPKLLAFKKEQQEAWDKLIEEQRKERKKKEDEIKQKRKDEAERIAQDKRIIELEKQASKVKEKFDDENSDGDEPKEDVKTTPKQRSKVADKSPRKFTPQQLNTASSTSSTSSTSKLSKLSKESVSAEKKHAPSTSSRSASRMSTDDPASSQGRKKPRIPHNVKVLQNLTTALKDRFEGDLDKEERNAGLAMLSGYTTRNVVGLLCDHYYSYVDKIPEASDKVKYVKALTKAVDA
ncbi:MAG: hypothetical protein AAB966_04075, partial [Patescibacteria group bacterium]